MSWAPRWRSRPPAKAKPSAVPSASLTFHFPTWSAWLPFLKSKFHFMRRFFSFLISLVIVSFFTVAVQAVKPPVFMADLANPNDFSVFANGGWDGNWYVGYNTCWIQKLSVPPK